MARSRYARWGVVAVVALLIGASVAGSSVMRNRDTGFNVALNNRVGVLGPAGGTLKVGSSLPCDSLDPARTFSSWCSSVQRLYMRNLMAFVGAPGTAGLEVVPDLAVADPTVSADYRTWTFTIKSNARWDDGSPVTSDDVRYSIERLYDPKLGITVSPDLLCLLSACNTGFPNYKGPTGKQPHLKTIITPSSRVVTFRLARSFSGFSSVLASMQFAPIERAREKATLGRDRAYATNPASNGPFKVTFTGDNQITFVRNAEWDQSTDIVRFPQVDSIVWDIFANETDVDQAVLSGKIDLKLNDGLGGQARIDSLSKKDVKDHLDISPVGFTSYLAIVPTTAPLDRRACREAIFFALNKRELQTIRGGEGTSSIATSMTPQTVLGFDASNDKYSSGANSDGNISAAHDKLDECGYPDGFEIKFAYPALGQGKALYTSVQKSLANVGIVVDPVESTNIGMYYSSDVGRPDNVQAQGIGLIAAGWGPTYASPMSFWSPIADGRNIRVATNQNYSLINDSYINGQIDILNATQDESVWAGANKSIEDSVMAKAVYLPYASDVVTLYRNSRLANVYVELALGGQYDLVNIGLRVNN